MALTVSSGTAGGYTASVVGTDPSSDLALIKAQGVSGLKAATLGDSSSLEVGDTVLTVGSPLGLEESVTQGIVSALHRTITVSGDNQTSQTLDDAIQTDAAINEAVEFIGPLRLFREDAARQRGQVAFCLPSSLRRYWRADALRYNAASSFLSLAAR